MLVQITDDFDLTKIADSGQCFRWTKTDDNTYRIIAADSCLYITKLTDDSYDLSCTQEEYDNKWQDYFDLKENYRGIRERIDPARDPFLHKAAESEKGIRILRQDPWEMLITFIISQNKNIPAIRRCVDHLANADEQTTISELTRLYGVGVKVANCVSLFGLHHIDAFPIDVWIKRILEQEYPNGYPYEKYSPYNGIYQQYMFAYYRHESVRR